MYKALNSARRWKSKYGMTYGINYIDLYVRTYMSATDANDQIWKFVDDNCDRYYSSQTDGYLL